MKAVMGDAVRALVETLAGEGLDPHTLAIAHRGRILMECAWMPWAVDHAALSYSASKTFTSLAVGFLEDEGRLSLDDGVGELLGLPNPHGLTVRHLLTMNTGHSGAQIDRLGFDVQRLLSETPAATPGTSFAYNSDATYALSCIVTTLTGERLTDYLRPRLLDPLGIGRRWMKPTRGLEQGFSGFHITVGDLARIGMMLADGGRVGGAQVVPAGYVEELSRAWSDTRDPSQNADTQDADAQNADTQNADAQDADTQNADTQDDWARGYGYQVWRNREGFRLDGAYGQFAVVIPERELVIAYQGSTLETHKTLAAFWRFVDAVGDALSAPGGGDADEAPGGIASVASHEHSGLDDLDAWTARATLSAAPDGEVAASGARIDETADGWTLTLPAAATGGAEQTIPVGSREWAWTTLDLPAPHDEPGIIPGPPVEDGTVVRVAARGEADAEGILVHVAVPTSPHRLIARQDADGEVQLAWHTVPLQGRPLATLAVPEWVTDAAS